MKDRSYIKEQHRQPSQGDSFSSLVFHRAPVVRVRLTWRERLRSLNNWNWAEFKSGYAYRVGVK